MRSPLTQASKKVLHFSILRFSRNIVDFKDHCLPKIIEVAFKLLVESQTGDKGDSGNQGVLYLDDFSVLD